MHLAIFLTATLLAVFEIWEIPRVVLEKETSSRQVASYHNAQLAQQMNDDSGAQTNDLRVLMHQRKEE